MATANQTDRDFASWKVKVGQEITALRSQVQDKETTIKRHKASINRLTDELEKSGDDTRSWIRHQEEVIGDLEAELAESKVNVEMLKMVNRALESSSKDPFRTIATDTPKLANQNYERDLDAATEISKGLEAENESLKKKLATAQSDLSLSRKASKALKTSKVKLEDDLAKANQDIQSHENFQVTLEVAVREAEEKLEAEFNAGMEKTLDNLATDYQVELDELRGQLEAKKAECQELQEKNIKLSSLGGALRENKDAGLSKEEFLARMDQSDVSLKELIDISNDTLRNTTMSLHILQKPSGYRQVLDKLKGKNNMVKKDEAAGS